MILRGGVEDLAGDADTESRMPTEWRLLRGMKCLGHYLDNDGGVRSDIA